MAVIHFILQGKGGVGKTMVASFLYQAIKHFGHEVTAFDTDPVNATLSGYNEFQVTKIELLNSDGNIDSRKFDLLLEGLAQADEDSHIVVDNGASSFIALASYMVEVDVVKSLEELGHMLFFHTVITGGQALDDTMDGFIVLATNFPSSNITIWLNPYFGEIEKNGKSFADFKSFTSNQDSVHSIVELPQGNKELIGKDLEQLFARKESFTKAIEFSKHIAVRSRLRKYWQQICHLIQETKIL